MHIQYSHDPAVLVFFSSKKSKRAQLTYIHQLYAISSCHHLTAPSQETYTHPASLSRGNNTAVRISELFFHPPLPFFFVHF